MFTGLVEETGVVAAVEARNESGGTSLIIDTPAPSTLLAHAALGDSISVDGACLTVTALARPQAPPPASAPPSSFSVGLAPETLRRTNLGALRRGHRVNLELAVRADSRMGGHFVQGHVDTVAEIIHIEPDGDSLRMRFRPRDPALLRYVVCKGYVALDGISLTVTAVDDRLSWWEVVVVAYTRTKVGLAGKKVGDSCNVEVDMLAKYAEKSVDGRLRALLADDDPAGPSPLRAMLEDAVKRVMRDTAPAPAAGMEPAGP